VINLYDNGIITDVYITTAMHVAGYDMNFEMAVYLVAEGGIPQEHIHCFYYGYNTAGEVAGFIKALKLQGYSIDEIKIVRAHTSAYHRPRTLMLLRRCASTSAIDVSSNPTSFRLNQIIEPIKWLKDWLCWPCGWRKSNDNIIQPEWSWNGRKYFKF
jgi:vancomycin permeability regulator SanA